MLSSQRRVSLRSWPSTTEAERGNMFPHLCVGLFPQRFSQKTGGHGSDVLTVCPQVCGAEELPGTGGPSAV